MPRVEAFEALGLYCDTDFLTEAECLAYRRAMNDASSEPAAVVRTGEDVERIDETRRKVGAASVDKATRASLTSRLSAIRSQLQSHFRLVLDECEPPQMLNYREGGFYAVHCDSVQDTNAPAYMQKRAVSVVIFLNTPSSSVSDDGYAGGDLVFHGLMKPPFDLVGLPLESRAGTLVAFLSSTVHEVRPVSHGLRQTAVTWFPGATR